MNSSFDEFYARRRSLRNVEDVIPFEKKLLFSIWVEFVGEIGRGEWTVE